MCGSNDQIQELIDEHITTTVLAQCIVADTLPEGTHATSPILGFPNATILAASSLLPFYNQPSYP